jgi:hypothetical protein
MKLVSSKNWLNTELGNTVILTIILLFYYQIIYLQKCYSAEKAANEWECFQWKHWTSGYIIAGLNKDQHLSFDWPFYLIEVLTDHFNSLKFWLSFLSHFFVRSFCVLHNEKNWLYHFEWLEKADIKNELPNI